MYRNTIVQSSKKLVILGYICIQMLLLFVVDLFQPNYVIYLILALFSLCLYTAVFVSNPGQYRYQSLQTVVLDKSKQSHQINIIKPVPSQLNAILQEKMQFQQLGIQSKIVQNVQAIPPLPEQKQEEKDVNQKCEKQEEKEKVQQLLKSSVIQYNIKAQKQNKICIFQQIKFSSLIQSKFSQKKQRQQLNIIPTDIIGNENIIVVQQESGYTILPQQLKKVNRWCRICKHKQQLRVRHCHQCNKCICNFDHHCLWLNNCIGEKNKLIYLVYLLTQLTQLYYLIFILFRALDNPNYKHSVMLLDVMIIILTGFLTVVFIFQFLIVFKNISTWQYMRWTRIQYLKIFEKRSLKSLFDRGIKQNLSIFLRSNCRKQPTKWINNISADAYKHVIKQSYKVDTERGLRK